MGTVFRPLQDISSSKDSACRGIRKCPTVAIVSKYVDISHLVATSPDSRVVGFRLGRIVSGSRREVASLVDGITSGFNMCGCRVSGFVGNPA